MSFISGIRECFTQVKFQSIVAHLFFGQHGFLSLQPEIFAKIKQPPKLSCLKLVFCVKNSVSSLKRVKKT